MEILFRNFQKIFSVIDNLSALNNGIAGQNTENRLAGYRFAGSGFTDDRQRFSFCKIKADPADCLDLAV